jgi:hypothetical protein
MKITLKEDADCGGVTVPKGEYMVALLHETQQLNLAGKGQNYKIPAVKRRAKANSRVTIVQFYSGGGNSWSLIVSAPKHGEWIAQVDYVAEKGRKSNKKF